MRSTPVESVSMKTKDGRQSKCANENRIIKYKKIRKAWANVVSCACAGDLFRIYSCRGRRKQINHVVDGVFVYSGRHHLSDLNNQLTYCLYRPLRLKLT